MGMYDILGGHQVKCFYEPTISHDVDAKFGLPPVNELNMWMTGGSLHEFSPLQRVPYKSMWYDYTENFMIFDLRGSESHLVHIISMGRYMFSIHYQALNMILFPISNVIDVYGTPLNITSMTDFENIISEYDETRKHVNDLIKEHHQKYKSDDNSDATSESEEERELKDRIITGWDEFDTKWKKERRFGVKWEVGAFLYGIHTICDTDSDVQKYVGFFNDAYKYSNIDSMVEEYSNWCLEHKVPIQLEKLQIFFETPTIRNLDKVVMSKKSWKYWR